MEIPRQQYIQLIRAVMLYQRLNNNNRSGVPVEPRDWAKTYQEGAAALAGLPDAIREEALKVLDEE